jgi:hypothetical protein
MDKANKTHRVNYAINRQNLIEHLGGNCIQCGSIELLQFDHIDPNTKEYEISKYISRVNIPEYIWNEIEKCQLLCLRCHKDKSDSDRGIGHGQGRSGKRNCPCVPCKARKSEYNRIYKAMRKG